MARLQGLGSEGTAGDSAAAAAGAGGGGGGGREGGAAAAEAVAVAMAVASRTSDSNAPKGPGTKHSMPLSAGKVHNVQAWK